MSLFLKTVFSQMGFLPSVGHRLYALNVIVTVRKYVPSVSLNGTRKGCIDRLIVQSVIWMFNLRRLMG